jgi:hypothetical protein
LPIWGVAVCCLDGGRGLPRPAPSRDDATDPTVTRWLDLSTWPRPPASSRRLHFAVAGIRKDREAAPTGRSPASTDPQPPDAPVAGYGAGADCCRDPEAVVEGSWRRIAWGGGGEGRSAALTMPDIGRAIRSQARRIQRRE